MELSLTDLRDLIAPAGTPGMSGTPDPLDPTPGTAVLIRTVTMTLTGRVASLSPAWIVLDDAAWIADTGRFADALSKGTLSEVEPFCDRMWVSRGAIVDMTFWNFPLPRDQK